MDFKKLLIRFALIVVIVPPLAFAAWTWGAPKYVYSSGERAGYVQKFSKRGWLFKTWEGELAMVNLPGAMPEKFSFSVRDGAVAKQIEQSLGRRTVLAYEQHRFLPTKIFAETEYFVVAVRIVDDAPQPGVFPVSTPNAPAAAPK